MTKIIQLNKKDIEKIMEVERKAFIPSIRTTQENIKSRLNKEHVYLGAEVDGKLVGTLALRYAYFIPNFEDFIRRYPTFDEYAESTNENNANAVFVYSIGIIPQHRNGRNAKKLLTEAFDIARTNNMNFLVGDARIPSYNGSDNLPYEKFKKNEELHNAINKYLTTSILPSRELIEKDPVMGFYLKVFPNLKTLGITNKDFWKVDNPCGGHMVIEYMELK